MYRMGLCTYMASVNSALVQQIVSYLRQGQRRHLNCRKVTATKFKPLTQIVQFRAVPLTDCHQYQAENVYDVVQGVYLRAEATHTYCVNNLYYLI
jgi:hypothetical protein